MDQQKINEVTSYIGFIFSDEYSWHEHIDHVNAKS